MEQSSCTEDRIEHVLERCLCDLGLNAPDKQLWNAGLCINRWCLEELVKRDPHNFLILLHKILRKTREVLEQSHYDLVVPLTLLFSSTLLKAPHVAPDCGLLLEAYSVFHSFLSWPEPCSSASRRLLSTIRQELSAPGISFQRLVRSEQGVSSDTYCSKTMTVLLVSPDEDTPPEVQCVSQQLSGSPSSNRDVTITLILHAVQAALGDTADLHTLCTALQNKPPEELELLLQTLTVSMEQCVSTADLTKATQMRLHSLNKLRESLAVTSPADGASDADSIKSLVLPLPKCHIQPWESNNFDILHDIVAGECDPDSLEDSFLNGDLDEEDKNDISLDEEDETETNQIYRDFSNNRISTVSSTSGDSVYSSHSLSSSWSVSTPSCSSGVDSDFSEDPGREDQEKPPKNRRKPKKKSKSLLGVERFSLLFRATPCRRAWSMGRSDFSKDPLKNGLQSKPSATDSPQRHMCIRRRPILSCDLSDEQEVVTQVRVVVFGGNKEVGRLARAYTNLQNSDSKRARLTKTCKLHFYFIPTKKKTVGNVVGEMADEGSNKSSVDLIPDNSTNIAHMLGMIDPWYERNVLSLLSLSSDVLCESGCKDSDVSSSSVDHPSLLADMVLYYCRHADQSVLLQLYQAELTLAGGEKRVEVFVHSLELGHSAATRAVKAMGAVSKRLGINEEREAVPLTLNIAYNKVAISGRSQWIKTEKVCTSLNLYKSCRKHEQLESLQLMMAEVLKRQCSKSKKSYNQISISDVKVNKAQVHAGSQGSTFAVCLDQDEKKFIQSVVSCEVSLCCKPGTSSDWRNYKASPGQVQPLHPSYCSLLCLPISSFCPSQP